MKLFSAAALALLLLVFSLAFFRNDSSRVIYEGRTVEEWIYNSYSGKEKADAEFAIMMLGEKAVAPLRAILRLKSPGWAVSAAWKFPLGDRVLRRPLQNVVKKKNAIECLEAVGAVGPLGERLLPDMITIAENEWEFLRLRQMALRYIHRHMPLGSEKSNILVRLSGDANLGPEAARYFQSFQRSFINEEVWRFAEQIRNRSAAAERPAPDLLSITNSPFEQDRSLWEAGRSTLRPPSWSQ